MIYPKKGGSRNHLIKNMVVLLTHPLNMMTGNYLKRGDQHQEYPDSGETDMDRSGSHPDPENRIVIEETRLRASSEAQRAGSFL